MVVSLGVFYSGVDSFDRAAGGEDVAIDLSKVQLPAAGTVVAATTTVDPLAVVASDSSTAATVRPASATVPTTAVTVAPVQPAGPARMVIVGDSQAHALAINLPSGIESAFTISDGSVEGCSVYDNGTVRSQRSGFNRSFADCGGWAEKWGGAAADGDAQTRVGGAGAWDVFDVELDGQMITFDTPAADQRFVDNLGSVSRRCVQRARRSRCSRCRACARPMSRGPACRRCRSVVTTRASPI